MEAKRSWHDLRTGLLALITVAYAIVSMAMFQNMKSVYATTPHVERSGSGVELRTLDYENPGSNPGCGVKTLG